MIKESITNLITDMQEVKAAHPTLEIAEVLRIFTIDATRRLAIEIGRHE